MRTLTILLTSLVLVAIAGCERHHLSEPKGGRVGPESVSSSDRQWTVESEPRP